MCSGTLLRRHDLASVLDVLALELYGRVLSHTDLPGVPDEHPPIDCPDCGTSMERYGYMGSHKIMIDGCPDCAALWLDARELGAMALLYARW